MGKLVFRPYKGNLYDISVKIDHSFLKLKMWIFKINILTKEFRIFVKENKTTSILRILQTIKNRQGYTRMFNACLYDYIYINTLHLRIYIHDYMLQ